MSYRHMTEGTRRRTTDSVLTRRRLLGGMVALGGAAAVAGCSGPSKSSRDSSTISVWGISLEQKQFHKKAAEEFHRTHPHITIEWRDIEESQYNTTLPLAFQSKRAPDLFDFNSQGPQSMSYLIKQKWIRPLAPDGNDVPADFKSRWQNPGRRFLDGVLVQNGVTYSFPFNDRVIYGPGYMFLHKKLFAKAGLDADDPPKTWSELRDMCRQLKRRTGKYPISCPMKDENINRFFSGGIACGIETDLNFDFKTGQFNVADDRMLQAFGFAQELYNSGYIAPGLYDKNFARGQFAAGQAAIYIDGSYMTGVWKTSGFDASNYTVHCHPYPDPGTPQGRLSHDIDTGGMWVSSQTRNPEACWEFLQWMTDPKGWFAKNYIGQGFGFLSYTDNSEYVTNAIDRTVIQIARTNDFRVEVPVPALKCKDIAKSKAYLDAVAKHPDWEDEERTKALLDKKDVKSAARKVASTRQGWLEDGLKKEAAKGLDVSMDCYTFPDWDYTKSYNPAKYPKR